ncbi:MAG: YicC family protein [Planctomycetaceae bacterium]|nr:YicC family protein [Planctomycetaceae bacterium]
MLQSMTGFGESHAQENGLAVAVEIRTINNRFFKLSVRTSEGYAALEPMVEAVIRQTIHRGTVQANIWVDRRPSPEDYRINVDILERYRQQLLGEMSRWQSGRQDPPLETLLALPGVVDDASAKVTEALDDWPLIERTLNGALGNLTRMRGEEGRAMAADLTANCRAVAASLDQVDRRAPLVVEDYRNRLYERLKKVFSELQVSLDPTDLIKEVGLFADRSDISEEIVRLRSHLDQFATTMAGNESAGRKLDFLTQEMFREANTIGSKANDVEIARHVIEIKTAIERIREMIQNVE